MSSTAARSPASRAREVCHIVLMKEIVKMMKCLAFLLALPS